VRRNSALPPSLVDNGARPISRRDQALAPTSRTRSYTKASALLGSQKRSIRIAGTADAAVPALGGRVEGATTRGSWRGCEPSSTARRYPSPSVASRPGACLFLSRCPISHRPATHRRVPQGDDAAAARSRSRSSCSAPRCESCRFASFFFSSLGARVSRSSEFLRVVCRRGSRTLRRSSGRRFESTKRKAPPAIKSNAVGPTDHRRRSRHSRERSRRDRGGAPARPIEADILLVASSSREQHREPRARGTGSRFRQGVSCKVDAEQQVRRGLWADR